MTTTSMNPFPSSLAFAGPMARAAVRPAKMETLDSLVGNPLRRLIQITRSNDRLLKELTTARQRLVEALRYVSDPESNQKLGEALVSLARQKHDRALDRLRANRLVALAILAALSDRD